LEEVFNYEKYMVAYEDENMERIPPVLGSDDKD
jgi:hypothetical protein